MGCANVDQDPMGHRGSLKGAIVESTKLSCAWSQDGIFRYSLGRRGRLPHANVARALISCCVWEWWALLGKHIPPCLRRVPFPIQGCSRRLRQRLSASPAPCLCASSCARNRHPPTSFPSPFLAVFFAFLVHPRIRLNLRHRTSGRCQPLLRCPPLRSAACRLLRPWFLFDNSPPWLCQRGLSRRLRGSWPNRAASTRTISQDRAC